MAHEGDNVLRINPRDEGADRRMMMTPDLWPLGPILPVKNLDGRLGAMVALAGVPRTRIFLVNIYERRLVDLARGAVGRDHGQAAVEQAAAALPHVDFQSINEILEAGWMVN